MFCERCGTRITSEMTRCPKCGHEISSCAREAAKNDELKNIPYYKMEMFKEQKIYLLGYIIAIISFILTIAFGIGVAFVIPIDPTTKEIMFSAITGGMYTLIAFTNIFALVFLISLTIAVINTVLYRSHKKKIASALENK